MADGKAEDSIHHRSSVNEWTINDSDSIQEVTNYRHSDPDDAGLIDNPLLHWKPAEIERNARHFARTYGLDNHTNVLIKGARILRDPEAWQSVPGLTLSEIDALRHERSKGFWGQPKELRITIITLCVAAVVQGWNQTASNGANLNWPYQFHLQLGTGCTPAGKDAWIFALVNAAPYLASSLIGCWLSDPLNEYFYGRRAAICISAIIVMSSVIGCAFTNSWQALFGCRILLGVGMGAKASVVPVFAAEVAPAHIRGSLVMNWQLFDAFGIFLGFSANLIASQVGKTAWRWQTASSALPAIVLLSLIWVCPESPRFWMKHGRYRDAYRTLVNLRSEPILAAKEILYIHYQMEVEMRMLSQIRDPDVERTGSSMAMTQSRCPGVNGWFPRRKHHSINYWQKLGQLFTEKRVRRAMISAAVCMIVQQACGVNVLEFYSSTIFCDASNVQHDNTPENNPQFRPALLLSWGLGLANFIFAFPAYWLIDKKGRRWLLLATLPFLAISILGAGLGFLASDNVKIPVVALFSFIFIFFYSWGAGPVAFTMSAEVFPLENRVVGMAFSVFVNLFGAGLLTLFVPALTNAIGHSGLLGVFAGLNVIAFIIVFFFVRETAGAAVSGKGGSMTFMSLEELNYIFRVSTKKHASYQLKRVLPWAWSRYIRRDENCPDHPESLYTWAEASSEKIEHVGVDQTIEDS